MTRLHRVATGMFAVMIGGCNPIVIDPLDRDPLDGGPVQGDGDEPPPAPNGGSGNTVQVPGTLEITSLDATAASLKLDIAPLTGWPDGNGDYTAPLCP